MRGRRACRSAPRPEAAGGIPLSPFILWDHDGVLVDTERLYFEATQSALASLGVELSMERYLELQAVGLPGWELARERGASEDDVRRKREERNALYQDLLRSRPIEVEGVEDVLADLGERHRMAIVTTARRVDFELIHAERDLVRHFEFILTVEDYPRPKPEPDPYLAALERFGARPEEAVVIEDSARGLASARAAGLPCLVIRTAFTAPQDFTGARHVVGSIREIPAALASLRSDEE